MMELINRPWPWYLAGPLIGLMVPALLLFDNKHFGISSTLRDFCAFVSPKPLEYFKYDLKGSLWRNILVIGVFLGGILAVTIFSESKNVDIASATINDLRALGIQNFTGFVPSEIFSWSEVFSLKGLNFILLGGFLIGFGTRWADGCTAGHAITGLSLMSRASLIAVVGFFIGGLVATHLLLPLFIN